MSIMKPINKNFSLIFYGNFISILGSTIYDTVIVWWLTKITGTSRYVSIMLALSMAATIVFSIFSGVIVDSNNKKHILILSDLSAGLACILLGYLVLANHFNIYLIYFVSIILGISNAMFRPSIKSIIPEIVGKGEIINANSLIESTNAVLRIIAPLIALVLLNVKYIGVAGCLFINGFSFVISSLFELFIDYHFKSNNINYKNIMESLKTGYSHVWSQKDIRIIIISAAVVNFFLLSFNLMLPLFIQKILVKSSAFYSIMLTAEALGALLISIYLTKKKNNKLIDVTNIMNDIIILGIVFTLFTVFLNEVVMVSLSFVLGLLMAYFNINFISYIQNKIQQEYLGRTMSFVILSLNIVVPFGYIFYGIVGEMILRYVFIISGVVMTIYSLFIKRKYSSVC